MYSHFDKDRNQFSSSSVKVCKHSATWQGRVSEFNPSQRPYTSDLTDALVKGPLLHVFQSIQVLLSVVCPSKLKTPACYMANILKRNLFRPRLLIIPGPSVIFDSMQQLLYGNM